MNVKSFDILTAPRFTILLIYVFFSLSFSLRSIYWPIFRFSLLICMESTNDLMKGILNFRCFAFYFYHVFSVFLRMCTSAYSFYFWCMFCTCNFCVWIPFWWQPGFLWYSYSKRVCICNLLLQYWNFPGVGKVWVDDRLLQSSEYTVVFSWTWSLGLWPS